MLEKFAEKFDETFSQNSPDQTRKVTPNPLCKTLGPNYWQVSRGTLQNGVSHRDVCVNEATKGGFRALLGEG